MKTLYESILSSTKAGKNNIDEQLIEFVKSCSEYKSCFGYGAKEPAFEVKWKNGKAIVNITPKGTGFYSGWRVYQDELDRKPKELDYIEYHGEPTDPSYFSVKLKNSKELVSKVKGYIEFSGSEIDVISSLPDNCNLLIFRCALYGGLYKSNIVKHIKNLKLKTLEIKKYPKGKGLNCPLENIKNNTIEKMYICTEMLGDTEKLKDIFINISGHVYLKEEYSKRITEFNNNNHIKQIMFIPSYRDVDCGGLFYDDKENLWEFVEGLN